jgi:hypothetical protein
MSAARFAGVPPDGPTSALRVPLSRHFFICARLETRGRFSKFFLSSIQFLVERGDAENPY